MFRWVAEGGKIVVPEDFIDKFGNIGAANEKEWDGEAGGVLGLASLRQGVRAGQ